MAICIACSIQMFHTPPELIINADQTGIHLLPSPTCTWNPKGDKQVHIIGKNEKRQVTLMMASTASGHLLKSQVIVPGKTTQSLPPADKLQPFVKYLKYSFSGGDKHWSNLKMMKEVHTCSVFLVSPSIHPAFLLTSYCSGLQKLLFPTSMKPKRTLSFRAMFEQFSSLIAGQFTEVKSFFCG